MIMKEIASGFQRIEVELFEKRNGLDIAFVSSNVLVGLYVILRLCNLGGVEVRVFSDSLNYKHY